MEVQMIVLIDERGIQVSRTWRRRRGRWKPRMSWRHQSPNLVDQVVNCTRRHAWERPVDYLALDSSGLSHCWQYTTDTKAGTAVKHDTVINVVTVKYDTNVKYWKYV